MITIRDIALKAGVSPSTVSRVLSGTIPVAPSKRVAVLAAVKKLHYRPSLVAQGLARGRSKAVGVLTQEISNLFYSRILGGIEQALRGTGYYPIFMSGGSPDDSTWALDLFLSYPVDALIVVGGWTSEADLARFAERVPVVAVARTIAGLEERCVQVANEEGAFGATRYLIEMGHRRIVHITGLSWHRDSIDRRRGYERALTDEGIGVDPRLIVGGDFEEESGVAAVEGLLRAGLDFTAVFASNDQMACGAGLALFRRGLKIPDDVSVVGFDDEPTSAYKWPPLTTVRQPTAEMGSAAVQAVLDELSGHRFSLPRFRTELIVRESAGPAGRRGVPLR
ncbi:MAG: LacI family DNA-binding transcriptional regulator [Vicinamibacteria bacterium]